MSGKVATFEDIEEVKEDVQTDPQGSTPCLHKGNVLMIDVRKIASSFK